MSRGQSQPRSQSGRRTLERCKDKGKVDRVVIIDVDNGKSKDEPVNVVIVDVPESSQQKFGGSRLSRKKKKCPSRVVISIDDEEGCDVEGPRNGDLDSNATSSNKFRFNPRNGDGGGDLDSDATSTKKFRFYPTRSHIFEGSDGNECQFVWGKKFGSCNRFGFSVSESSAYESDSSDCEVMEGSSGKIREQWEKAASRRKMGEGIRDEASASGSNSVPRNSSDEASPKSFETESLSICSGNGDTNFEAEGSNRVAELDKMGNQDSYEGAGFRDKEEPGLEEPSSCKTRAQDEMQFDHGTANFQEKELPSSRETRTQDEMDFDHGRANFQEKEPPPSYESCEQAEMLFDCGRADFEENELDPGEPSFFGILFQHDTHVNSGSCFQGKEESILGEAPSCNTPLWREQQVNDPTACFQEEGERASGGPSSCNTRPRYETKVNCESAGFQYSGEGLFRKPSLNESQLHYDSQVNGESSFCNTKPSYETQVKYGNTDFQGIEQLVLGKLSLSNCQQPEEIRGGNPLLSAGHKDGMPDLQSDIIGDREKFKETEEYRRAIEEEWASRKLQLQIQAEEAQRLRKRKKAENLRLLNMERRQKQRLEEMRQTQKKDQETINLKEQLRVEVRKELEKLEVRFNDMASLLRGLGITVGGGPYPLSRDVNAAYKQALLRFHPDRASRLDIRQQVEAEETFKLISRLKEKLPAMA